MRKCGLWSMVGDRKLCSDGMRRYIRRTLYLQSVSRCPLSGFREKGRTRSGRGNGEEASSGHFGHFGIFLPRARAMLPFLSFLLLLAGIQLRPRRRAAAADQRSSSRIPRTCGRERTGLGGGFSAPPTPSKAFLAVSAVVLFVASLAPHFSLHWEKLAKSMGAEA